MTGEAATTLDRLADALEPHYVAHGNEWQLEELLTEIESDRSHPLRHFMDLDRGKSVTADRLRQIRDLVYRGGEVVVARHAVVVNPLETTVIERCRVVSNGDVVPARFAGVWADHERTNVVRGASVAERLAMFVNPSIPGSGATCLNAFRDVLSLERVARFEQLLADVKADIEASEHPET